MVKAINQKVIESDYPKKVICEQCGEELEYDKEDEHIGLFGMKMINCPCCGEDTFIEDRNRIIPPTFPTTFYSFGNKENNTQLSNEEIQEHIDTVVANLKKIGIGEYTLSGSGNIMVFGFKYEDEDVIHVSKDFYEDNIFKE